MRIQICSDLHLEFKGNRDWLNRNPLIPKGEILIIAGDTYYLEKDFGELDFINKVSEDFEVVYLILGNHEYYGGFDVSTGLGPTIEKIKENVFLLNNKTVEINNVSFIFSTMWSKIHRNILGIMRGMADFTQINYQGGKFTVNHFNELHEQAFGFLSQEIKKDGKKIVVTHHLPSNECNIDEFKGSDLNEAFCVDLTKFIFDHEIDCWIYGHSHRNLKDFEIGNTLMVTNQLGYVNWGEHHTFNYEKVVEV